jgi:hypothetical protein
MQHRFTLKYFVLNALLLGALLSTPLHAHAAGGDGIMIDNDIVETSLVETGVGEDLDMGASDAVVNVDSNDEDDEDAAMGSVGQPEYKYVSIRRFSQ